MKTPFLTLALETSSRLGSLALGRNGAILAQQSFSGPMRHSAEVLPTLQSLLHAIRAQPADIQRVCLSIGPGSFTGLRIAVAMTKGIALSRPCEVVAVSSLDVLAANAIQSPCPGPCLIAPVIDAKRGQFFMAAYLRDPDKHRDLEKIVDDSLLTPTEFRERCRPLDLPIYLLGDGLTFHRDKFANENTHFQDESHWSPQATQVYFLGEKKGQAGEFEDPYDLKPAYLREALVTVKGK